MKKNFLKGLFVAAITLLGSTAFAAGTFQCEGKGVKLNGVYGSLVGRADLKGLKWNQVISLDETALAENSSAFLTDSRLLAIAVTESQRIQLETEGAPADSEDKEPTVYGGVLKVTSWDQNGVKPSSTKSVAVTCTASY